MSNYLQRVAIAGARTGSSVKPPRGAPLLVPLAPAGALPSLTPASDAPSESITMESNQGILPAPSHEPGISAPEGLVGKEDIASYGERFGAVDRFNQPATLLRRIFPMTGSVVRAPKGLRRERVPSTSAGFGEADQFSSDFGTGHPATSESEAGYGAPTSFGSTGNVFSAPEQSNAEAKTISFKPVGEPLAPSKTALDRPVGIDSAIGKTTSDRPRGHTRPSLAGEVLDHSRLTSNPVNAQTGERQREESRVDVSSSPPRTSSSEQHPRPPACALEERQTSAPSPAARMPLASEIRKEEPRGLTPGVAVRSQTAARESPDVDRSGDRFEGRPRVRPAGVMVDRASPTVSFRIGSDTEKGRVEASIPPSPPAITAHPLPAGKAQKRINIGRIEVQVYNQPPAAKSSAAPPAAKVARADFLESRYLNRFAMKP